MYSGDTLTLRVLNSQTLASGKAGSAHFCFEGGLIGSADSITWSIQDQMGLISDVHAKISVVDTYYCLTALAPNLFLNTIDLFTHAKPIRLQHGDRIHLCQLTIHVQINRNGIINNATLTTRPEDIITNHRDPLKAILDKAIDNRSDYQQAITDEAGVVSPFPLDPMQLLDAKDSASEPPDLLAAKHTLYPANHAALAPLALLNLPETDPFNSVQLVNISSATLSQGDDATKSAEQQKSDVQEEGGTPCEKTHIGESKKHYLNHQSLSQAANTANPSFKAYQAEIGDLLHAIEKEVVALASPAVIAKNLAPLKRHFAANQYALCNALSALLAACAPDAVMTACANDGHQHDTPHGDADSAWRIYNHRYGEQVSHGQQELVDLFWEVYAHIYDQTLHTPQHHQNEKDHL